MKTETTEKVRRSSRDWRTSGPRNWSIKIGQYRVRLRQTRGHIEQHLEYYIYHEESMTTPNGQYERYEPCLREITGTIPMYYTKVTPAQARVWLEDFVANMQKAEGLIGMPRS